MAAVRMWVKLDLRRRWTSLTVLALLVALASGVIMATLAGARRGATVFERQAEQSSPATVAVLANTPGFDWGPVEQLPSVEALTGFVVDYAIAADGPGGFVGLPLRDISFPPTDDATMRTVERPVVLDGRLFDATRADEVVVTAKFVRSHDLGIGDAITFRLPTPEQLADSQTGDLGELQGPSVRATIVGVVVSPWFQDQPGGTGSIVPSPGLAAQYPANILGDPTNPANTQTVNTLIRLRGGEAAIPEFTAQFEELTKRSDIDIWNLPGQLRDAGRHIRFEAQCLIAFALSVLAAGLFLIGQAIVRYTAGSTAELQTLRAIGMTPRQAVLTASVGPVLSGLAGVLVGAAAAGITSSLFPFGTGRYAEPEPGIRLDWLVLPGVALGVVLLIGLGAAVSSALAASAGRRDAPHRRSAVATGLRRAGFGVPVVVGSRFALEPGRGRTAVPVRPAILGSVVGVLGVVAAFTFANGVSDAGANPQRFGQTFQLNAYTGFNGQTFGEVDDAFQALLRQPEVAGAINTRIAVATGSDRSTTTALYEYGGSKPLPVVLTAGRMPQAPNEVVLAPRSLAALHTAVGETIRLNGTKAVGDFTVTGSGFTPIGSHNNYSDGGYISTAGFDSLFDGFKFRLILIALNPGVDPEVAANSLATNITKAVPEAAEGGAVYFEEPEPPIELAAIRQVQGLPIALGLFLALLALGAVGHAVATAVRRRSSDIAILRVLGMTRWQSRGVVVTQASLLAVIGLVFGVPLGLATGRVVWQAVADFTPMEYVAPLAFWTLLLIGPLALIVANLLAAWPGHRAARLQIAHVLRAE